MGGWVVQNYTDNEAITAQLVVALKDLKTTSLGGWWSSITLIIRLSQPQAGDWAWLAWAELGNMQEGLCKNDHAN